MRLWNSWNAGSRRSYRLCQAGVVVGALAIGVLIASPSSWGQPTATPPTAPKVAGSQPATGPAGPSPKARCDEPTYDFKEIWAGDKVDYAFEIANDGEGVLEITSVRAGCGCTATEYDKKIEPGKKGKVHASVRTSGFHGPVSKPVYVTTNDPKLDKITLTLKGTIKDMVAMTPPGGAQWARVTTEAVEPIKVRLTNNTDKPMKLQLVAPGAQHEVFKAAVEEVEAGKVFDVVVTPKRPFAEGANFATLQFNTGIEGQPTIPIPCRLFSPPALEVSPDSFTLGAPPAKETPRLIEIRYNGDGALKVLSATCTEASIKANVKEVEAGKRFQVMVTLPGGLNLPPDKPAQVKIATDYAKRPEIIVPIMMRTSPRLTPPPGARTPAEALVGKRAPQTMVKMPGANDIRLGAGDGKVMAVDFFVSWGKDSARQLPMIQRLAQDYRRKGVEFVLVSADDFRPANEIAEKLKHYGLNLPIALDPDRASSLAYGAEPWPTLVLIGKTGFVEAVYRGAGTTAAETEALAAQIRANLDAMLDGKSRSEFPVRSSAALRSLAGDTADFLQPAVNTPIFSVESLRQDIGLYKPGEAIKFTLPYRNKGQRTLEITKITAQQGGPGLKIDPEFDRTLEPAVNALVKIEGTAPQQPGDFASTVTIESNDPARPVQLVTLVGTVRPYLEVDPAAGVDFTRNPRLHSMKQLATLIYNGPGEVKYLKTESTSPTFKAEVDPIGGTPYAKLTVEAEPPFQPGENRGVIRITTDCQRQEVLEVPATLFMPERIEVLPAEVLVSGSRRLQQASVRINNNGDKPLHILEVARSNERIMTQFYPQPDGMSYELRMTLPSNYSPPPAGDTITIRTDDAQRKEIVIPIRMVAGQSGPS